MIVSVSHTTVRRWVALTESELFLSKYSQVHRKRLKSGTPVVEALRAILKHHDDKIYASAAQIIHKLLDKNTNIMIRVDSNVLWRYFQTDDYKRQTGVVRTNVQKKMDDTVTKSFNAARRVFQKFPSSA